MTCVIPTDPTWTNPQIGDRITSAGTFRFFAMPARLLDERSGKIDDIRDLRFDYPRATPEKALLDWIYLGASKSRMTRPPFDVEVDRLNKTKLNRIAKSMGMIDKFSAWINARDVYQKSDDVMENSSVRMRF